MRHMDISEAIAMRGLERHFKLLNACLAATVRGNYQREFKLLNGRMTTPMGGKYSRTSTIGR